MVRRDLNQANLGIHTLQYSTDTVYTTGSQSPESSTPNAHRFGAQAKRLDDISTATDPTIDIYFDFVEDLWAVFANL
jgi:hypothetical protein